MSKHKNILKKTASKAKGDSKDEKNPKLDKRFKHNWRIDMLAIPKNHKEELEMFKLSEQEKADYIEKKKSEISIKSKKSKRKIPLDDDTGRLRRIHDLSYFPARFYNVQRTTFKKNLGKKFLTRMERRRNESSNTMYNEYRIAKEKTAELLQKKKAQKLLKITPSKSKSASKKSLARTKSHADKLREAIKWCEENSNPKKIFKPPKINRGKIANLAAIMPHIKELSTRAARFIYKRPSKDSMNILIRNKVTPAAMAYIPTDRILEMAKAREGVIEEQIKLGAVKPEALTYKATPRILEIAIPKARAATKQADFNENAFTISPTALKYVATPRILELAKPLERD